MDQFAAIITKFSWLVYLIPLVLVVIFYKLVLRLFGVVMIPDGAIGIVTKKFVLFGSNKTLPDGEIIALKGEAGVQADTLAPGVHFFLWPWQYDIQQQAYLRIPNGKLGVVEAAGGKALDPGRVLARHVDCDLFQDARKFLESGGQRGPQISVIPPGTYRINTALFSLTAVDAIEIDENMIGVITTMDGNPLPTGEIAGREVASHNNFQNGEAFINNGGFKGLQTQVILAGRYFINPRFATVEQKPMTQVPIAHAGVVISYVGEEGQDVTGDSFKHGNLVRRGQKGVWADPLDPGMYPMNPYTHKIECVPTANVVLNWATGKTESHKLDANLSTITVRSSDGFTFNLDVSQIIHIPRNDAPKVIARFGNVANLVTQVLEPTIGNYFRNAAQDSDVIDFLRKRSERQGAAREAIEAALREYNVAAVNTLIGDIAPPEQLMKTLTDRKVAEQQTTTFETQRIAQDQRQRLEQATALANTQALVVDSERKVAIAKFDADANINKAQGEASAKTIEAEAAAKIRLVTAEAEAKAVVLTGDAEGKKVTAIGEAEAAVIEKKTKAIGQEQYAQIEVFRALAASGLPLVPTIVAGGEGGANNLLAALLAQKLFKDDAKIPV